METHPVIVLLVFGFGLVKSNHTKFLRRELRRNVDFSEKQALDKIYDEETIVIQWAACNILAILFTLSRETDNYYQLSLRFLGEFCTGKYYVIQPLQNFLVAEKEAHS